jgi:uncharacterized phage-associated protein
MSSWELYDDGKIKELILYVAEQTETDGTTGSTKLNKILYFAELSHMRRTGHPISGAEYQKQPQGPTLRMMRPLIRDLEEEGAAKEVDRDYHGMSQRRIFALRDVDLEGFSAMEIATVDGIIRQLWDKNAKEVSEMSHEDLGWNAVEMGEAIPLEMAFLGEPEVTDDIRERARQLAEQHA